MAAEIILHGGGVCVVDDADFALVSQFKWWSGAAGRTSYAVTNFNGKPTAMHTMLMPEAKEIDHANGDGLDNRRVNLRACSHAQNAKNRRKSLASQSRFKGLSSAPSGAWRAEIEQDGERLHLGTFHSEVRAAMQYDRAARLMHGKFARTNEMLGLFTEADWLEMSLPPAEKPRKAAKAAKVQWSSAMLSVGIIPKFAKRA